MPASIIGVRMAAAHDGVAELAVRLRYANGGETEVILDRAATDVLLQNCAVDAPAQLIGQSWMQVRDALQASSNRFQAGVTPVAAAASALPTDTKI